MSIQYIGLSEINGPLVALDHVKGVGYDEIANIRLSDGTERVGRIVEISGEKAILQVFEGTKGLSLTNTKTSFTGKPMELALSEEMLGRVFSGSGKPIDGLGDIYPEKFADINGKPLSHNKLAVQIVRQAKIADENGQDFAVVFGAMGVKNDVADYFKKSFAESGVQQKVVMFMNLSNDPIIERILTPRCALTAAEYLAFEKNMHILVILTDITSYCEALREFSSSKGEIPGRKGYPGYLYSDLASLYERAGIAEGSTGSVTQIPILTMPNDDITHPIPDLTGYITEGQIVLDRSLDQTGIYPSISILPSLSRLMKDGIGEGYTRFDHSSVANQLFAAYAKVQDARALASVIGEEELSEVDRQYMKFGVQFEKYFITQGFNEDRSIEETLDLGWALLSLLPVSELDRIDEDMLNKYYDAEKALQMFK